MHSTAADFVCFIVFMSLSSAKATSTLVVAWDVIKTKILQHSEMPGISRPVPELSKTVWVNRFLIRALCCNHFKKEVPGALRANLKLCYWNIDIFYYSFTTWAIHIIAKCNTGEYLQATIPEKVLLNSILSAIFHAAYIKPTQNTTL